MKFTKRFEGSYYAYTAQGEEVSIQSMLQYTGEQTTDQDGNKWVMTFENDWEGDRQMRAKTKAELVAYATKHLG